MRRQRLFALPLFEHVDPRGIVAIRAPIVGNAARLSEGCLDMWLGLAQGIGALGRIEVDLGGNYNLGHHAVSSGALYSATMLKARWV